MKEAKEPSKQRRKNRHHPVQCDMCVCRYVYMSIRIWIWEGN